MKKIFTALILILLILPPQAEAARLWSSGFESQSMTAAVEIDTTLNDAPTISTTIKRSGGAAMRCNPTSTGSGSMEKTYTLNATAATVRVRFYVYIDTAPATDASIMYWSGTYGDMVSIVIDATDNSLYLYNIYDSVQVGSNSSALATDTWYLVELEYQDTGGGSLAARLNGSTFASDSSPGWGGFQMGELRLGCDGGGTATDIYFDDVAVNDANGTTQNSWPGEGRIVHLYPNAAGDNNTWEKSGGAAGDSNNYQDVDEVTPDDATTYLKRVTTTIKVDDYNVTNTSTAGIDSFDTISLVQVGSRAKATSNTLSSDRNIYLRLKKTSGGTVSKSSSIDYSTTVWETHRDNLPSVYVMTAYLDPDGAAWTPTTIETMQIGMENTTDSTIETDVSSLWALVEYVDGTPPAAAAPTGPLYYGVGKMLITGGKLIIN